MNLQSRAFEYLEVEHKYIVQPSDRDWYLETIKSLNPQRQYQVSVEDYYILKYMNPKYVYRHRKDSQLHQLTVKSLEQDSKTRLEVNLNLVQNQSRSDIEAFLSSLGEGYALSIHKHVDVFYFEDVEIVYYKASTDQKSVCCVELELRVPNNNPDQVFAAYESKLNLDAKLRCHKSLFHILAFDNLPADVQASMYAPSK